ncbi:MAG: sulfurtransferase TusA family protein [Desulfitobacteriaceae bacterium]|jgi:TusA-related sulfurtransferase|nr:sulfurtransferase TusA family protein [Desulfitobacteriaceae bacterium]MDD4751921.1 sulfurtransferase TusA family protein [Desulfitobacteriaceae bacterium]
MREIDVCGMSCPEPVIRTQQELKNIIPGEKLRVLVDSDTARENITRLVTSKNLKMEVIKEEDYYALEIEA